MIVIIQGLFRDFYIGQLIVCSGFSTQSLRDLFPKLHGSQADLVVQNEHQRIFGKVMILLLLLFA